MLLNPRQRIRAELSTTEVSDYVFRLREGLKGRGGMSGFLTNPQFTRQTPSAGEATFRGKWLRYKMKTMGARTPAVAAQYAEFSNWYTRLNAIKNPGLLASDMPSWFATVHQGVVHVHHSPHLTSSQVEAALSEAEDAFAEHMIPEGTSFH